MKRTLLAICVGAASQAMAQVPESRVEHVLVTVPIHKKAAETALPVTVLSGEELRRSVTSTLGETLGDIPGISNSSFGRSTRIYYQSLFPTSQKTARHFLMIYYPTC